MECKKCGQEIEEGYEICLNCGSAVDFNPIADDAEQEEKIEEIVKKKPVQRLSRQMLAGVALFIIAGLCVGLGLSYASRTLVMYSGEYPDALNTTKAETTGSTTATQIPTVEEPALKPYSGVVQNQNRKMPLKISACYVAKGKSGMPKAVVKVENISDYTIDTFTVKVAGFDKNGERIFKNSSANGGFVEMKYTQSSGVIEPGKISDALEENLMGFEKGTIFQVAIISAHSIDGYKYEFDENKVSWKTVTLKED